MPVRSRTLVVCGDDLGLHPAVNEGIARAHDHGLLRSASLMATGEAAAEGVALARERADLTLGVHLSLLDVPPAGDPAPWKGLLDDRGFFPPSAGGRALTRIAARASRRPAAALAEFEAQIRRARELGARPAHLDAHNHLHLLPRLFPGVVDLCLRHDIRWIRVPRAPLTRLLRRRWAPDLGGAKGTLIRAFGRSAAPALRPPVRAADHLIGLGLHGAEATVEHGVELAERLGEGVTEWMVHPVAGSRDFPRRFPWGGAWGDELATICHPSLAEAVARQGIRVAGFGALR